MYALTSKVFLTKKINTVSELRFYLKQANIKFSDVLNYVVHIIKREYFSSRKALLFLAVSENLLHTLLNYQNELIQLSTTSDMWVSKNLIPPQMLLLRK